MKSRLWPLVLGSGIILLSLWALHRFCDAYSDSVLNRKLGPGGIGLSIKLVELVCLEHLGVVTIIGVFGVTSLLAACSLRMLSSSYRLLRQPNGAA